jgi:YaaC-like Protein
LYSAALTQFDELIAAAAAAGAASRPLPLFYALSQAGRAIAAAHADEPWRLDGHGLSTRELAGPILGVEVKRAARQNERSVDSVTGVAHATGSDIFDTAATLGSLWSSLPAAYDSLPLSLADNALPLRLVPREELSGDRMLDLRTIDPGRAHAVLVGFRRQPGEVESYLGEHYPQARGIELFRAGTGGSVPGHYTPYGTGLAVRWQLSATGEEHLDQVARELWQGRPSWLRPSVAGTSISLLMTWWALLFGLSMLARYEPVRWLQALDYDSSRLAAPLDELLRIGLERVPDLVLEALRGDGHR